MQIKTFTFNAFAENTYVLYDDTGECIIIDPGCNTSAERQQLDGFILREGLEPVALVNTHCHIDHVLGNDHISEKYGLQLVAHKGEIPVLEACEMVSKMYGIPYTPSPEIAIYLDEGEELTFGDTSLQVFYTPGHSPASISFYHVGSGILIAGDVLFQRSIGRTDLPGGDFDTLISSIRTKLFTLPDDTVVYPGHGPTTTIGEEKKYNPFLNGA